jgi:hypothetical protein
MAQVTIKIYQSIGSAAPDGRKLVRTVRLKTASDKRLTSKRAGQLLAWEFPQFAGARDGLIKSDEGWVALRSLRPTERCSFHYVWERAVVTEDDESSAAAG